ncbi:MAG TPA: DUF1330 domain-containing protein [Pseudolabrys sp.]
MKAHVTFALAMAASFALGAAAVERLHAQAKPPAYAIIEAEVSDVAAYMKEYAAYASVTLTDAGGKFLARSGKAAAMYGEPPQGRIIIIAFDSLEKAQAAFASEDFQAVKRKGDKYAKFRMWVVEGLPQ